MSNEDEYNNNLELKLLVVDASIRELTLIYEQKNIINESAK